MLRVGLTQRVQIQDQRKERWDCLDQAWSSLLTHQGILPIPLPNSMQEPAVLLKELELDAVLLTGGNDLEIVAQGPQAAPERDLFEANLLTVCSQRNIPVLGVCRGLQMMVVHYGGKVRPVPHHVATTHSIQLKIPGVMPLHDGMVVNSFHNFGVLQEDLGPHVRAIATAPDGSVEAIAHETLRQWAVMWHPERPPGENQSVGLLRALLSQRAR